MGDVFRWSLATITTVCYGDAVPVTALRKAVGNIFMVSGIAILSAFISSLLAFFIKSATPKTLADEVKRRSRRESTT